MQNQLVTPVKFNVNTASFMPESHIWSTAIEF